MKKFIQTLHLLLVLPFIVPTYSYAVSFAAIKDRTISYLKNERDLIERNIGIIKKLTRTKEKLSQKEWEDLKSARNRLAIIVTAIATVLISSFWVKEFKRSKGSRRQGAPPLITVQDVAASASHTPVVTPVSTTPPPLPPRHPVQQSEVQVQSLVPSTVSQGQLPELVVIEPPLPITTSVLGAQHPQYPQGETPLPMSESSMQNIPAPVTPQLSSVQVQRGQAHHIPGLTLSPKRDFDQELKQRLEQQKKKQEEEQKQDQPRVVKLYAVPPQLYESSLGEEKSVSTPTVTRAEDLSGSWAVLPMTQSELSQSQRAKEEAVMRERKALQEAQRIATTPLARQQETDTPPVTTSVIDTFRKGAAQRGGAFRGTGSSLMESELQSSSENGQ